MSQLQIWDRLPEEEIVVKANELVTSHLDWTPREYRIFVAHVSQISKEDEDVKNLSIKLRDLCDLSEVSPENLYSEIEGLADRLTKKRIHVEEGAVGHRQGGYLNVYSSCEYNEEDGTISGSFTEEMRPLLLRLKQHFTMYYRRRVLSMRSTYSMRFYEIVKRYEYEGHFKMSVDEIRKMFGLEDKYKRFGDLKRYVIEKAQSDLKENTDLTFKYDIERQGRTPIAVYFDIQSVRENIPSTTETENINQQSRSRRNEKDPIEEAYDGLPQEKREDIRQRAKAIAQENNPSMSDRSLEAQMWLQIRRLVKEECF